MALHYRTPTIMDSAYLYRTTFNHQKLHPGDRFDTAIINLGIGAFILSLGKVNSREIGPALRDGAASLFSPDENERAGILANIEYLRENPPEADYLINLLEFQNKKGKVAMRLMAVEITKALNAGKTKKLAVMEKFYEFLKLDLKLARSDLQSGVPKAEY